MTETAVGNLGLVRPFAGFMQSALSEERGNKFLRKEGVNQAEMVDLGY